jgi:hypothetical protein
MRELNAFIAPQVNNNAAFQAAMKAGAVNSYANVDIIFLPGFWDDAIVMVT